jgi:hypothetical protein
VPGLKKEKVDSSIIISTAPLSLAPERGSFVLALMDRDEGFVQSQIGLSRIGLVAVTKSKFRLDESTVRILAEIDREKCNVVTGGIDQDGNAEIMVIDDTIRIKRGNGREQVRATISFTE